jgi:acetylornithine deacetylase/succinyl-diaminopimelate desuccinylase-like protein
LSQRFSWSLATTTDCGGDVCLHAGGESISVGLLLSAILNLQISSRDGSRFGILRAMTRTGKLLAELIALPSVNPAFTPPAGAGAGFARPGLPNFGEKNVADFLAGVAGRFGLEVQWQKVLPGRANLLVRLAPKRRIRQTILLAPHLDTVGADDQQFRPKTKNGRMHGRGACDTKGSVAAMMMALGTLAAAPTRPQTTEIVFAGLIDEENVQAGSRALAASGFKADLAIVGEPTKLSVVTAHKGSLWLRLQTQGRAAHGATPQLGKNAIHTMARVVERLETDYARGLRRRKHPLLGVGTVNVGRIAGGRQANIVPDHCEILVDRRTLPGETEAGVRREIAALLRTCRLRATISSDKSVPCLALETDLRQPLVHAFCACTGQTRPAGVHYFCDAAVLSAAGIPSIVFGPGDIAQAHTADEWIDLAELERAKDLLLNFIQTLP